MKQILISIGLFIAGLGGYSVMLGSATLVLPAQGGTGLATKPTAGQLLVGNASGTYSLAASTTLPYVATEVDPVWTAASSSYGLKSNTNVWTGSNSFTQTLNGAAATFSGNVTTTGLVSNGTVSATGGNSTNWNTAYGWGNHASAGYLTASGAANLTNKTGNISQWTNNSGYLTAESDPIWLAASTSYAKLSSNNVFTGANTFGVTSTFNTLTYYFPSSHGAGTRYLSNDGTGNLTWASISGGGDAFLANTQTFTGLNTFYNLAVTSTATTTISVDTSGAGKGACLKLKDRDGVGYTYLSVDNGIAYFSTNPCN